MTQATDRSLKMLATALKMEQKGKTFYDKAVSNCNNELGKRIFTMLAIDELIHIDRIQVIYKDLMGASKWSKQWETLNPGHSDLSGIFRKMAQERGKDFQAAAEDIEALTIGVDFEAAAVKFYQDQVENSEDPIEKAFLEKMIIEEKDHHSALVDMRQYLQDPGTWFMEKEKAGLDGA